MQIETRNIIGATFFLLATTLITIFFFVPEDMFQTSFKDKIELSLTISIAFFAMVEAFSTYVQTNDTRLRLKIEDLRNEMETAYGILYTIIEDMYWVEGGGGCSNQYCFRTAEDKEKVDELFRKYPFMLRRQLMEIWEDEIKSLEPVILEGYEVYDIDENVYEKFQKILSEEYHEKLKQYKNILH